jgi:hypothetical protein
MVFVLWELHRDALGGSICYFEYKCTVQHMTAEVSWSFLQGMGLLNELLIRFLHNRVRLLLQKSPTRATLTRVANSSRLEEHSEAYSLKCLEG